MKKNIKLSLICLMALLLLFITVQQSCKSEKKAGGSDSASIDNTPTSDSTFQDTFSFEPPVHPPSKPKEEADMLSKFRTITTKNGEEYYIVDTDILLNREEAIDAIFDESKFERKAIKFAIMLYDPITKGYVKWTKFPASFCIDKASFPKGKYDGMLAPIHQAILDWQNACGVSFDYKSEYDIGKKYTVGKEVDFVIAYKDTVDKNFVATSFYPENKGRTLYILPKYWNCEYDKSGIFRHEIGHILGFRHEEARNSRDIADYCRQPAEINYEAVNRAIYDTRSVMHYPCGGNGTTNFEFSDIDLDSFLSAYPKK